MELHCEQQGSHADLRAHGDGRRNILAVGCDGRIARRLDIVSRRVDIPVVIEDTLEGCRVLHVVEAVHVVDRKLRGCTVLHIAAISGTVFPAGEILRGHHAVGPMFSILLREIESSHGKSRTVKTAIDHLKKLSHQNTKKSASFLQNEDRRNVERRRT